MFPYCCCLLYRNVVMLNIEMCLWSSVILLFFRALTFLRPVLNVFHYNAPYCQLVQIGVNTTASYDMHKSPKSFGCVLFQRPGPSRSFSTTVLARARAQPFFFAAPAGPGGPKLARPLASAVIGHAHLSRFSCLQMASASDVHGKMIIVS